MKKVLFICVTMLLICISGKATERNLLLIPYPQQVSIKQGNYNRQRKNRSRSAFYTRTEETARGTHRRLRIKIPNSKTFQS